MSFTFEFQGTTFYMDSKLAKQMDKHLIPALKKKDKDWVSLIDGGERSGKSVLGQLLSAYYGYKAGVEVKLENICLTPQEFHQRVENAEKNDVIIFDEAHRGLGSRRAMSEVNNLLVDLIMEMGQKNLFVIIILPTFFMLDRYPALFRSKGLFHIYEDRKGKRKWVYYNERNKKRLFLRGKKDFNYNCMKFPKFRGTWWNRYVVDEEEYRAKKALSFKKRREDTPKLKADKYLSLYYKVLMLLVKKCGNQRKAHEFCSINGFKIDRSTISKAKKTIQGGDVPKKP